MAWEGSDRRSRLPTNWSALVKQVWERDKGQCTWRLPSGKRCPRRGAEVDHRVNNDDHSLRNLQLLCAHHHGRKTQREAWSGRTRRKSPGRAPEKHPGLIVKNAR